MRTHQTMYSDFGALAAGVIDALNLDTISDTGAIELIRRMKADLDRELAKGPDEKAGGAA